MGHIAGEGVAEVAGGHREADLALGRAQGGGGGEIVDALGRDTGEVDRVDARQIDRGAEVFVLEGGLHDGLAVVEGAFDRDAGDIAVGDAGHEPALDLADAALGEQHHDADVGAAAESLDGGAAGVARGGGQDGDGAALSRQHMVVQPPQQLHGHVLERQGRAMEQLQQEQVRLQLLQGRDGGVGEGGIGLGAHVGQDGRFNLVAGETAQHGGGHLVIGLAREPGDFLGREGRPGFRHIQAAVRRQAGQDGVEKADRGGAVGKVRAGGNVVHRGLNLRQSMATYTASNARPGRTRSGCSRSGGWKSRRAAARESAPSTRDWSRSRRPACRPSCRR